MHLYNNLVKKTEKLSVIGLGYVGLPIAVSFARKINVIGFDVNRDKVEMYKSGKDPTKEVGDEAIGNTTVDFTSDEHDLQKTRFHIIAVPTPVSDNHTPDLKFIQSASGVVGRNLTKGSIVVFESTVYPGVTEEICVPILEKESGLICGVDFKVGYSPERINPGDKTHRLENIIKIVSGMDEESRDTFAKVYEPVVEAGVYRAESIKVAEAAKVIENAQRDINIAFMNELSIIFNKMGIDTQSVLTAAGTKWNFLKFTPGLVGGHCIGVDPYYLTYKAAQLGYQSQIILAGRRINDGMGHTIVENLVKLLIHNDMKVKKAKVAILGFTFKENCPDTRNSKVMDIVNGLKEYGITPMVSDPVADKIEAYHEYGIQFTELSEIKEVDVLIVVVAHREFQSMSLSDYDSLFKKERNKKKILLDIKGIVDKKSAEERDYVYWRL